MRKRWHSGEQIGSAQSRSSYQVLSAEEIDRFIACLTATRQRDRAIVWLLKDGGVRIHELLALRLSDV